MLIKDFISQVESEFNEKWNNSTYEPYKNLHESVKEIVESKNTKFRYYTYNKLVANNEFDLKLEYKIEGNIDKRVKYGDKKIKNASIQLIPFAEITDEMDIDEYIKQCKIKYATDRIQSTEGHKEYLRETYENEIEEADKIIQHFKEVLSELGVK